VDSSQFILIKIESSRRCETCICIVVCISDSCLVIEEPRGCGCIGNTYSRKECSSIGILILNHGWGIETGRVSLNRSSLIRHAELVDSSTHDVETRSNSSCSGICDWESYYSSIFLCTCSILADINSSCDEISWIKEVPSISNFASQTSGLLERSIDRSVLIEDNNHKGACVETIAIKGSRYPCRIRIECDITNLIIYTRICSISRLDLFSPPEVISLCYINDSGQRLSISSAKDSTVLSGTSCNYVS